MPTMNPQSMQQFRATASKPVGVAQSVVRSLAKTKNLLSSSDDLPSAGNGVFGSFGYAKNEPI